MKGPLTEVAFRSDVTVVLDDALGSDALVCRTARVQDPGLKERDSSGRDKGLLRMLMRDRHGTPWESVVLRFYVEAPVFVAREAHRHRIASVNETSGRYRELEPVFYLPGPDRRLVQTGKPGAYAFESGTADQQELVDGVLRKASTDAYAWYRLLLDQGVAREVAQMVLPVSIYTSWYVTVNLRSLLNFLSLRMVTDATTVPTFPRREIEMVAEKMEALAAQVVPESIRLFNELGRISP